MKKTILLITLLSILGINAKSQGDTLSQIQVIARALPGKIILRWAPTSTLAWQYCNKYGFKIERVTMTKKNKLIKNRKIQMLTSDTIKLWNENQWETIVYDKSGEVNKYVAIAAQAIFGESFEITEDYTNSITKIIQKSQENEMRFTFALFAADKSLNVAKAMGLMFIDSTAVADEKYLYRVSANVPLSKMQIDTGYVYIGIADHAELPRPLELNAHFEDHQVTLSWNRELFQHIYTDYIVERSDNGKDFSPIGDLPFINTSSDEYRLPRLMYRQDSLPENNKTYYYRIKGTTPFEEIGPWSDTISGRAFAKHEFNPQIISSNIVDNKVVELKWELPTEHATIEYFTLYRAQKENGNYTEIAANINPEKRTFTDKNPLASNYYIVQAFDSNKQSGNSFPYFVQLVDSFPPAKPRTPNAIIDSLGTVVIYWQKSPEEDIDGYRVFRSNFKNSEFGQVTTEAVKDTIYIEKIKINNLSKKIYYKIAAVDRNFNQSELSDAITLIKPDTIPPVPPLFNPIKSTVEGVRLAWINSSSKDVVKQILYRKAKESINFHKLQSFSSTDTVNSFIDNKAEMGILYEYVMTAIDDSGNESAHSKSVLASKINSGIKPAIDDIKVQTDNVAKQIIISWYYKYIDLLSADYLYSNLKHYLIYRATSEEPIRYYKMLAADKSKFMDKNIKINTKYTYMIKAIFKDGSESTFSKKIIVNF